MGLLYGIGLRIVNFIIFFLIIILLPSLPPRTTFPFKEFEISPPKELKGALEPNQHLDGVSRKFENSLVGPECILVRDNEFYTGVHGGNVLKFTLTGLKETIKIGEPCENVYEEELCGRPLGLAFDTKGNNLIVADAYYGMWIVDLATHKKKLLISPRQELPGKEINRPAKTINSVAIDKHGDIYYTDSTSDFTVQDLVFASLANPSGRLFKYDRSKNVSKVLLDELHFANGVALSPDEDFIVVAETGSMRLMKYHLKGAKAGKSEIFVEGLPGSPDNLTPDADGIWVPLVVAADSEHPSTFMMFARFPNLRLFMARMLSLFELPFRLLYNVYPNKLAQRFTHFIGHFESFRFLLPKRATIVRVDWNGNIVGSLHGFDGTAGSVSHVAEYKDYLVLGSPTNRFVGVVKLPKASQPTVKVKNVRYEGLDIEPIVKETAPKPSQAKPTTTTPKPTTTTTTPPPTTTRKPATTTTTTTPKPKPTPAKTTTTTTSKPKPAAKPTTTTTTAKPPTTTTKRVPPKQPAPVKEEIPSDNKAPKFDKLKVINQRGEHVEL